MCPARSALSTFRSMSPGVMAMPRTARAAAAIEPPVQTAAIGAPEELQQRVLPRDSNQSGALQHHLLDGGGEAFVVARHTRRVAEPCRREAVIADSEIAEVLEAIPVQRVRRQDHKACALAYPLDLCREVLRHARHRLTVARRGIRLVDSNAKPAPRTRAGANAQR